MKTVTKFYGIMSNDGDGTITLFIDYEKDFDGRLLRHSFTINMLAFQEYMQTVLNLPEYEINATIKNLIADRTDEVVAGYLLLSRHEWIALDEDNNPIVHEPLQMFQYINQ